MARLPGTLNIPNATKLAKGRVPKLASVHKRNSIRYALDQFTNQTQKKVTDMTAVLLMESFVKDGDVCTGGDCDNKGKDAISNVKLLLLDPKDIAALR